MGHQPEPPGQQARQLQPAVVHHRRHAADGGQVAVVAVAERLVRLAAQPRAQYLRHVHAHLLGCGGHARHGLAVLLHAGQVADHEHLGMPGQRQVGRHRHAARPIGRHAQLPPERRRRHARRPQHGAALDAHRAHRDAVGIDGGHGAARVHLHAQRLELPARLLRQRLGHGRQQARAGLHQVHARAAHVGAAELARQGVAGDLGQRAGQLHAGRPAADHHELEPAPPRIGILLALGGLEGGQHAAADRQRVLERLQARRVFGPGVLAEVGVRGAGGHQQVVVVQRALRQRDAACRQVNG